MKRIFKLFGIVLLSISMSVNAKKFDPHGDLQYIEVPNTYPSCLTLEEKEKGFFQTVSRCNTDRFLLVFQLSKYSKLFDFYKITIKSNATDLFSTPSGNHWNIYDAEIVDSACGEGVVDFLTEEPSVFLLNDIGKMIYFKGYDDFFAATNYNGKLHLHCNPKKIANASH